VDPLPQALVLTAIVIGVGTTAIALVVAKMIHSQYHTFDLDEIEESV
jgi:multicomponent Na+:H+ antiporter subunit C